MFFPRLSKRHVSLPTPPLPPPFGPQARTGMILAFWLHRKYSLPVAAAVTEVSCASQPRLLDPSPNPICTWFANPLPSRPGLPPTRSPLSGIGLGARGGERRDAEADGRAGEVNPVSREAALALALSGKRAGEFRRANGWGAGHT